MGQAHQVDESIIWQNVEYMGRAYHLDKKSSKREWGLSARQNIKIWVGKPTYPPVQHVSVVTSLSPPELHIRAIFTRYHSMSTFSSHTVRTGTIKFSVIIFGNSNHPRGDSACSQSSVLSVELMAEQLKYYLFQKNSTCLSTLSLACYSLIPGPGSLHMNGHRCDSRWHEATPASINPFFATENLPQNS